MAFVVLLAFVGVTDAVEQQGELVLQPVDGGAGYFFLSVGFIEGLGGALGGVV
ncbi:hypothetical protein CLV84_0707 [Neolewinella xylanilytica]|uniref:Uncharacterized protein n=1 Tax=Neolewinella xylanilytica TaxID=1514080 RepID=A0A2S6I8C2_9BACT|nr:hypothetical protein [Neolewinella xylanilytica]PPK87756.1 hypothetical protein CLV84_0707 [Neolewinella xylanilytica]